MKHRSTMTAPSSHFQIEITLYHETSCHGAILSIQRRLVSNSVITIKKMHVIVVYKIVYMLCEGNFHRFLTFTNSLAVGNFWSHSFVHTFLPQHDPSEVKGNHSLV